MDKSASPPERIIVVHSIAKEFKQALVSYVSKTYTQAGHAINVQSTQHGIDIVLDVEACGAKFLVGRPEVVAHSSVKPTIVTSISDKARILDEETFGPRATIHRGQ